MKNKYMVNKCLLCHADNETWRGPCQVYEQTGYVYPSLPHLVHILVVISDDSSLPGSRTLSKLF